MKRIEIMIYSFIIFMFVITLTGFSPVQAQSCTDSDGDTYAIEGGACGAVDCNDNDSQINPGLQEFCSDGKDNNCDTQVDEVATCVCPDFDGDGDTALYCGGTDCDDSDANVHRGAALEICDGKDTDCNGWKPPNDVDADGDGFPVCAGDCDDSRTVSYPGAPELCDGVDNNCDRVIPVDERDFDSDGYIACGSLPDCDPYDPTVNPGSLEICNDGKDNNCDSEIDEAICIITCLDIDGDGYGTNSDPTCPKGPVNDCNDNFPSVNPGAKEGPFGNPTCTDLLDNNCDGLTDIEQPSCMDNCIDNDSDGYGIKGDPSCPEGTAVDCDDSDATVHPGAPFETCDGKDTDCNGWKPPNDKDADGDGFAVCAGDCDDTSTINYPGAPELCDGRDNNCDRVIPLNERDVDKDGYRVCDVPPDCNPYDPAVNPGHVEVCSDGKDNNCNGQVDEPACTITCVDNDGDGYGTNNDPTCPKGRKFDCDDTKANVYPGAKEGPFGDPTCSDVMDNNCDGLTDVEQPACMDNCIDNDGDGYGGNGGDPSCPAGTAPDCDDGDDTVNPGAPFETCDGKDTDCDGWKPPNDKDADGDGFPVCAGDCDDTSTTNYPGAPELCDGRDNNCDRIIPLNERDIDKDGVSVCDGDCNDFDSLISPELPELCDDNKDNNCNSEVDEVGCVCPDLDNDGLTASYCGGTDCDDSNAAVKPGAVEECNDEIDNDCDGLIDIADPDAVNCPICSDGDGDTYNVEGGGCGPVDCDDTDADVHPGADEICDGKDTDCDGWKPPNDRNEDGDPVALCAGDCDDNDPEVYPGLIEHLLRDNCDDGLDNDCDSLTDQADPGCGLSSCETQSVPKNVPHFFTLLNTDDTIHPDSGALSCGKCHGAELSDPEKFACQRCHADPSDTSDPLNGQLKEQYPLDVPYGFGSAPNVAMHSSEVVGTKYGTWTMGEQGCVVCHNPHAQEQDNLFDTDYGMYIKEYICFDNDVTGERVENVVELTAGFGDGSFADGPPHNANVCETCHTRTNHHQSDGSAPGGQSHFDGVKCTTCHLHGDGFTPSGNCLECHNQSPPLGSNDPERRQVVEGTPGDGEGDFVKISHHVTDGTTTQVVDADSCEVCHDLALHTIYGDGVSVLLNDQDGGDSYTFDGTGGSIEGFCVSCHDSDGSLVNGAEPFVSSGDTNNPPDIGWTVGGASHSVDDVCFNCHGDTSGINAHGSDSEYLLKYNNYTFRAAQTFCYNCHNGTVASTNIEALFSRANSHLIEDCQVCHDQHGARPGTHAPEGQWYPSSPDENTNDVSGVLSGVYGVEPAVWPDTWGNTEKTNFIVLDEAEKEYQICFKCHSKYAHRYTYTNDCFVCHFKPDENIYKFRSGVREFNSINRSAHPVVFSSANQTGSYKEDLLNPGQMIPHPLDPEQMSPPWTNTGNQTMYCADCHGADNEDTADPRGPHGSERRSILKGTGQYWPTGPDGTSVWRLNTTDAANPDLFCKNCHPIYSNGVWQNNVHQSINHNNLDYSIGDETGQGIPCVSCHYIVPHGGRRSRLIAYYNTNIVEYVNITRVTYNPITGEPQYVNIRFNAIKGFKKEDRFNYQVESCFTSAGLGCHVHETDGGSVVGGYDP